MSSAKSVSKFLSLVLRHDPGAAGVSLDPGGWVTVDALLANAPPEHGLTRKLLAEIVATSDKQRFALSPDGRRIRANQGHSVAVDLGLTPRTPPETLYHGTAETTLPAIRAEGLKPGQRQHVHLSPDAESARRVGQRHGRPVVLAVAAARAHAEGQTFWLSDNGVWLTGPLAAGYLA